MFFAFAVGDDQDGDAVIDSQDKCPNEPGPYSDFPDECGCPTETVTAWPTSSMNALTSQEFGRYLLGTSAAARERTAG